MIEPADFKLAEQFADNLPVDEGVVTRADRQDSNGEEQRVWAVEYPNQTVLLEFVFDATEKEEKCFADLLAKGAPLIVRLAASAFQNSLDAEDTLHAFETTFRILMRQVRDLRSKIPDHSDPADDEDPPTVGEKDG